MCHFLVYFCEWGNKRFSIKLGINWCGLFLFRWIWDYSIFLLMDQLADIYDWVWLCLVNVAPCHIWYTFFMASIRWEDLNSACSETTYGLRLKCRPIIQCMNAILYFKPLSKLILCFFLNEQDNLQSQQTNSHTNKKLLVVCLHFKLMTKCWMRRKRNPIC